ncbi:MAG: hypothetical protein IJ459_02060 [Clostridia bacterium]|nr:hypothetical protein [Clostridia bacterium]
MKSKLRIGSKEYNIADEGARNHVGYVESSDAAGAPSLAYELSADGTYYIVTGRGTVKGSEIIIPDTYEGKPVREVAVKAFYGDEEITKITVGANVTYIGGGAIVCPNLAELYFNTSEETVRKGTYRGEEEELYDYDGWWIDCEQHGNVRDGMYPVWGYGEGSKNCATRFNDCINRDLECGYEEDGNVHTIDEDDIALEIASYA